MSEDCKRKRTAIIYADLERSALGTPSRIAMSLAGQNVLSRTISRLKQVQTLDEIVVFCPADQQEKIKGLLDTNSVLVQGLNELVPVSNRIKRRKWALSSWRGGIREATVFDEQSFTPEMVQFLRDQDNYTALAVPAEAVLLDPELVEGLLEHHRKHGDEMRFTFCQAAPGLCGGAYRMDLLHELVLNKTHIGDLLNYSPENPQADLIVQECNYKVDPELYTSEFRYIADTERNFAGLQKLLEQMGDNLGKWDAKAIAALKQKQAQEVDILPREVEIEITTTPSLRIKGYPHRNDQDRAQWSAGRNQMDLGIFKKIVEDLGQYDDICLTIGGVGEPLAHPDLLEMIQKAQKAGIFGINIETDGRLLKGQLAQALSESPVDVLSVYVDAHSRDLYRGIKGEDAFEEVVGQLEEFSEKSKNSGPMIIPHLVKSKETMPEMEDFYDGWISKCGSAVIVGYNDYAGQIEDHSVMNMCPPQRRHCRRVSRIMNILADGSVTICGQDFQGKSIVGNVGEKSMTELWRASEMEELRKAHQQENFEINELCASCGEWHR